MKTKHKLDKPFGETGTTVGYVLIIAGVAASFNSLYSLILLIPGAFIAFTAKYTILDSELRKVKSSDHIFGLFPTGKWIDIKPNMKLSLKNSHKAYRIYSRSNRKLDVHENDIRITLYDAEEKPILDITKFTDKNKAYNKIEILSQKLGIPII